MKEKLNVIAVDGPAGSGKSTVAKRVAKGLGFLYIDTGAMYRALTLKAIRKQMDLEDESALTKLSCETEIRLEDGNSSLKVLLDGEDVSDEIRDLSVSEKVRFIARVEGVRNSMVKLQRAMGKKSSGAVLEGRDIGTVVFPDAAYKFYLDASFDERVKRRFEEFEGKGVKVSWEDVKKDVETRDNTDKTRRVGALKKADDAVYVDTTKLTVDNVVSKILDIVKNAGK